jgi:hypothetical protein
MTSILDIPSTRCPALQILRRTVPFLLFPFTREQESQCTLVSHSPHRISQLPFLHFMSGPVQKRLSVTPCHPFTCVLNCNRPCVTWIIGSGWRHISSIHRDHLSESSLGSVVSSVMWVNVCRRATPSGHYNPSVVVHSRCSAWVSLLPPA